MALKFGAILVTSYILIQLIHCIPIFSNEILFCGSPVCIPSTGKISNPKVTEKINIQSTHPDLMESFYNNYIRKKVFKIYTIKN